MKKEERDEAERAVRAKEAELDGVAITSCSVPAGIVELDELELLVVFDNETDTLSSVDEGVPQIPEIARRVAGTLASRQFEGYDCREAFDDLCCACHGFSVLATGRLDGREQNILFDVVPSAEVWLANARRLGVRLASIDHVFLSHWHFDHSGGLPEVVAAISSARALAELPPLAVDLHPDRPDQRGILTPGGMMILLPQEPTFEALRVAGGRVATDDRPHEIAGGFFFASGKIDRVTDYEQGLTGHHTFCGGEGRPDPPILDERFVAAAVKGRGVTVLSACSHAGVVNACLAAREHFPEAPIDVVLGGRSRAAPGRRSSESYPNRV